MNPRRRAHGPPALALAALLAAACAPPPPAEPAAEPGLDARRPDAAAESAEEPARGAEASAAAEPDEWVVLETDAGEILVNVFEERTPVHAENFKKLVRQGWYDGSPFHRVVPGFVAQAGGKWQGDGGVTDVGYTLPPEIRGDLRHVIGSVAAARRAGEPGTDRRSSGSQFYICYANQPALDGEHTVFGHVIRGLEAAAALRRGSPGREGAVEPGEASVIRRAWIRPADPPGSAVATTAHHR